MVIHEFGHFIFAKKFGIDVEEFGVGYPPRIFGKKIGNTLYSLNWIPFGAFVKIKGEIGGIEDRHSFSRKPMWQRMLIILGGVLSFWLISIILLSIISGVWGLPTSALDEDESIINPKVSISYIVSESPAAASEIVIGDVLVGFKKAGDFQNFIKTKAGEKIILNIENNGKVIEKEVKVESSDNGEGFIGVGLSRIGMKKSSWWQAPISGVKATYDMTVGILSGWVMAFKSFLGIEELPKGVSLDFMGPVGILTIMRDYFSMGLNYFLYLISLISIALALGNILPIPALDGGKMFFLIIEAVRRKPIDQKIEGKITGIFFALLILFMVFVTIKFDIPRLF
jgi:regulator of sigma E protease